MIMPHYRLGYWWTDRWHHPADFRDFSDEGDHFIFVEEAISVELEGLLRPDGVPISHEIDLGKRPWRFRSSGIRIRKFLDVMDRIEPLDHDNITGDQRRQRRSQLVEELSDTPLPLFDLYVDEMDEDLPFFKGSFTSGSWYWIGVRRREAGDLGLPVFVGAPELAPGPYSPGTLAFIEAVPPYLEYRLRDVFSLAHIPDADFEEIGREPAPPPDKPHGAPKSEERSPLRWKSSFDQELPPQEYEA